jgi:hypothetical protein
MVLRDMGGGKIKEIEESWKERSRTWLYVAGTEMKEAFTGVLGCYERVSR